MQHHDSVFSLAFSSSLHHFRKFDSYLMFELAYGWAYKQVIHQLLYTTAKLADLAGRRYNYSNAVEDFVNESTSLHFFSANRIFFSLGERSLAVCLRSRLNRTYGELEVEHRSPSRTNVSFRQPTIDRHLSAWHMIVDFCPSFRTIQ